MGSITKPRPWSLFAIFGQTVKKYNKEGHDFLTLVAAVTRIMASMGENYVYIALHSAVTNNQYQSKGTYCL